MSLGAPLSFAWLGLLVPLLGFSACSGTDSAVNTNENGLPHGNAGAFAVGGAPSASGVGGGNAGSSTSSLAGSFAQGGNAGVAGMQANVGGAPSAGTSSFAGGPSQSGAAGSSNGGSNSGGASNAGGSPSGGSAGAAGASALFAKVSTILGSTCGIKGCHADKQSPHFVPGSMLYATLTATTVLAECDYTKLVEPGDPEKSALVRLMNRKCGDFTMPPSCNKTPCLAAADLQALSDWIQAGAPP